MGSSDLKELDLETYNAEKDNKEYDFQTKIFLACKEVAITKIYELRQNNEEGSTLHVEFDLNAKDLHYNTASNLVIFPENEPKIV